MIGVCHEHVGHSARLRPSRWSLRKSPGLGNLRFPSSHGRHQVFGWLAVSAEQERVATSSLQLPYLPFVLYHDFHHIVHLISLDLVQVVASVTSRESALGSRIDLWTSFDKSRALLIFAQSRGFGSSYGCGRLCKRSATATPDQSSQH